MRTNVIKAILITIIIAIIIFFPIYIIDLIRMTQHKPVIFSTWGISYEVREENNGPDEDLGKYFNNVYQNNNTQKTNIKTALTLEDNIENDTVWCGTFQLIWNDLKNKIAKQDIVFIPNQLKVVQNLNKETFKEQDLSDKYYYKKIGTPTPTLKQEIENAIKQKFNETSDILDDYDWENYTDEDFFLYSMLKKEFQFEKEFEELAPGTFGDYQNIKYFGINKDQTGALKKQVTVLYYNGKNDFAIKLKTKQQDEVILCKNPIGNTFNEIYQNIKTKQSIYTGSTSLKDGEKLKIPNITIDKKERFNEIEQKSFYLSNNKSYHIEQAIQTIKLELDRTGGKIKSESGMMAVKDSAMQVSQIREFSIDNTFAMFLIEQGKTNPYFAGKITDITKFQK